MPAPVGILAGIPGPETPGNIAERGMIEGQRMDLAQQQNERANQASAQSAERFSLEKQLQPYAISAAEQHQAANNLRFEEAVRSAKNKQEAQAVGNEMYQKAVGGNLSENDFLMGGIRIAAAAGDPAAVSHAVSAAAHAARGTDQGKAQGKLISEIVGGEDGGLFFRALKPNASIDDMSSLLKVAAAPEHHLALNLLGGPIIKQITDRMKTIAPPEYVDAVSTYYAKMALLGADAKPTDIWRQAIDENPGAEAFAAQGHQPPDVTAAMKGEGPLAIQTLKNEASDARTEGRSEVAKIRAESALAVQQEREAGNRRLEDEKAANRRLLEQLGISAGKYERRGGGAMTSDEFRQARLGHDSLLKEKKAYVDQIGKLNADLAGSMTPESKAKRKALEDKIADLDIIIDRSREDMVAATKAGKGRAQAGEEPAAPAPAAPETPTGSVGPTAAKAAPSGGGASVQQTEVTRDAKGNETRRQAPPGEMQPRAPQKSGINPDRMRDARAQLDRGIAAKKSFADAQSYLAGQVWRGKLSEAEEQRLLSEYQVKFK